MSLAQNQSLPIQVMGRLQDRALVLDLRGLEDEAMFLAQLDRLVFARQR